MIDSLFIDLGHEVKIKDSYLVVERNHTASDGFLPVRETGLWQEENGRVVKGRRAYFRRTSLYPFDIDYKPWRDGKLHFLVKFSVPELLYGTNRHSISQEELEEAYTLLKQKLTQIGVQANPREGRIIRVDLFKQEHMITGFDQYAQLFRRMKVPHCDVFEHNTSYLWRHRSRSWAINVYDKNALEKSGEHTNGLLRIEMQLRKPDIIERVLATVDPKIVVNRFDSLTVIFSNFINGRLNIYQAKEEYNDNTFNSYSEILNYAQEKGKSRWRAEALEEIGLAALSREMGIDAAVDLLAGTTCDASSTIRSRRSRLSKQAKEAVYRHELGLLGTAHTEGPKPKEVAESIQQIIGGRGPYQGR